MASCPCITKKALCVCLSVLNRKVSFIWVNSFPMAITKNINSLSETTVFLESDTLGDKLKLITTWSFVILITRYRGQKSSRTQISDLSSPHSSLPHSRLRRSRISFFFPQHISHSQITTHIFPEISFEVIESPQPSFFAIREHACTNSDTFCDHVYFKC